MYRIAISILFFPAFVFAQGGGHNQVPQPHESPMLDIMDVVGGVVWDAVSSVVQDELGAIFVAVFGIWVAWAAVVYVIELLRVMGLSSGVKFWQDQYQRVYNSGAAAAERRRIKEAADREEFREKVKQEVLRRKAERVKSERKRIDRIVADAVRDGEFEDESNLYVEGFRTGKEVPVPLSVSCDDDEELDDYAIRDESGRFMAFRDRSGW